MRRWLAAALCLLLSPLAARAWNADGHRLTGLIARRLLSDDPALLARTDVVLAGLRSERHRGLVAAGTWMDDTARRGVDDHWHYIDLAFDGATPAFDAGWAAQDGREHGPWALDQARAVVRAGGDEQPQALARVLHLVADLHQPLHCAERRGDRGGNLVAVTNYQVRRDGRTDTEDLHTLWDWAAGLVWRDGQIVYDHAFVPSDDGAALTRLLAANEPAPDAATLLDSRAWAKESYLAACTAVYGRAPVNQGAAQVVLPADYVDQARDRARQRLVLAGHRLAAQLRDLRPALMGVP